MLKMSEVGTLSAELHTPPSVCVGEHLTSTCQKTPDTPATCAICRAEHPADYRKCPTYVEKIKIHSNNFMEKKTRITKMDEVTKDLQVKLLALEPNKQPNTTPTPWRQGRVQTKTGKHKKMNHWV
ncbi:hypothetical protein JTB14_019909 [Gonioctena quinquepunctata]|nr:hypothetical protein JTB14_019909 [Gonioctena quinquepunctata]